MKLLRKESVSDDPDQAALNSRAVGFILTHAPELLRAGDADDVLATADLYRRISNNTPFVAASERLHGLDDAVGAADSLKTDIERIPMGRTLGPENRATLAFAIWQLRGPAEKAFLTDWFYSMVSASAPRDWYWPFFRNLGSDPRSGTEELLASIVNDARFDETDWAPLSQVLGATNATMTSPLVDARTITDYSPASRRPDQQQTLAAWRDLLRRHFAAVH